MEGTECGCQGGGSVGWKLLALPQGFQRLGLVLALGVGGRGVPVVPSVVGGFCFSFS